MERLRFMEQYGYKLIKLGVGFWGAFIAQIKPAFPMMAVCFLVMLADSYTAWRLSIRVRERYPDSNDGKFKSKNFGRLLQKTLFIMMYISLAFLIQKHVFTVNVYFPNMLAGAFCAFEMWSILENKSSCNDEPWAKFLQKFLVSKVERHFDENFKKRLEETAKDMEAQKKKIRSCSKEEGNSCKQKD